MCSKVLRLFAETSTNPAQNRPQSAVPLLDAADLKPYSLNRYEALELNSFLAFLVQARADEMIPN